jgi:hypothetical protein
LCILPDAVNTVNCSWWWAKTSPETCRTQFQLSHDTSRQRHLCILPDAVNTFNCSWWWAKTSPETCRVD